MPRIMEILKAAGLRSGEYAQLFYARRAALDHVASMVSLEVDLPAGERRGFRARVVILGRDADGGLRARIEVTAPNLASVYVRKVRLVKQEELPYGLGSE